MDAEGTPVHGLHADWDSSNRQVVHVNRSGETIGGKPGTATLTVRAGSIRQTVSVTVIDVGLDQFGGRPRDNEKTTPKQSGVLSPQKANSPASRTGTKLHHVTASRGAASVPLIKAGSAPLPQHGPTDNPLPDAQTSSLYSGANGVGAPPSKTVRGGRRLAAATEGTENPGAENFNFSVPVFGLAGRGVDAALDLVHNSQLWNKSSDGSSNFMNYDVDSGWPAPGWRLGFGQIENQGGYGMTLTDPDGTRHALIFSANYNADTNDGTFIHYTGNDGSGTLYYPDGTQVEYGAGGSNGLRIFPTKITDNNGNRILISYVGGVGPKISSIEDTLQRHVTFYYASNGDLVTIKAPGFNGATRVVMRLYYSSVSVTTSGLFASSITLGQGIPSSVRAISHIYLPNTVETNDAHIGYSFDYTSYGMMYRAQQFRGMSASWSSDTDAGQPPSGGTQAAVTMYNYEGGTLSDRSIPSTGLTDTPSYTKRTDNWAGRTTGMPNTGTPGDAPYYQFSVDKANGVSTVTAPDGSVSETDTIVNAGQWNDGLVSDIYIDKTQTSFLSLTHIDWDSNSTSNPRMSQILTTDAAGWTKATVLTYASTYNNISVISERAFTTNGTVGSELRRTERSYETSANYTNRHLLHLTHEIVVYGVSNGTATAAARVTYEYDNYGSNHGNLTHRDDIIAHDPAFDPFQQTVQSNCHRECWDWEWPHTCNDWEWVCDSYNPYDPSTDYRGNVTKITTYPDATNTANKIERSNTFDIAGNTVTAEVDCCQQKSFIYSGAGSGGNHDYAHQISVTRGSGSTTLTTSTSFDYSSGLIGSSTDENGRVTYYYYNCDSLRLATIQRPDGSTTSYYYGGGLQGNSGTNGLHSFVNTVTKLDSSRYLDSYRFYDGRGAVTQTFDNYASSNWSTQDIEYDVMGRAYRNSNPYYSGGYGWLGVNPDGFWTSTEFDHLGRGTKVTMPRGDNTNSLTTDVQTNYYGSILVDFKDQAGKVRRQRLDEFGRIMRFDEPNSSNQLDVNGNPYQPTNYEYDPLDNLTHITQGSQERFFKYDSLSRLIRERNVEQSTNSNYNLDNKSWTRQILYNSSSLVTESDDARGTRMLFTYDNINRITQTQYKNWDNTDQGTPTVTFTYDQARNDPQGNPYRNLGRLTTITTGSGTSIPSTSQAYDHDQMGQVVAQRQTIGSTTYSLAYIYNFAGELLTETYPSGRTVNYTYDDGARLSTVTTTVSGTSTTLANSFQFEPDGGLSSETWGNNAVHSMTYNRRLQATEVKLKQSVNGPELQRYNYSYGVIDQSNGTIDTSKNNGQIGRIDGYINGATTKEWDQRFSYDELGRLATAAEFNQGNNSNKSWQMKYTYDRWGNRLQNNNSSDNFGGSFIPVDTGDLDAATNRFKSSASVTYDDGNAGVGNVTSDSKFRSLSYSYDANNRQTSAANGSAWTESQIYDGVGRRVQTRVTTSSVTYRTMVFDIFGNDVADYTDSSGGTLERENLYRGGLLAYQTAGSALSYVLQDIQGTTRAVVDSNTNSAVISRHDYLPFGGEIWAGTGQRTTTQKYATSAWTNDNVRQRYGLTERDDTTGLDNTLWRKYESLAGRWTSPDPDAGSASITDPQSLNRYSYTQNDPINSVDPTGLRQCFDRFETPSWTTVYTDGTSMTLTGHRVYKGTYCDDGASMFLEVAFEPPGGGQPSKPDPNGFYCKALAAKIANLQSMLVTHVSALIHNPGSLPEFSPTGKIKDGVTEHRDRLLDEAENLVRRIKEYTDNCGGPPPTVPPVNQPRSFRNRSTNFPNGYNRGHMPPASVLVPVAVGAAVVVCLVFAEVCIPIAAGGVVAGGAVIH
jgi:RHS repeat-associated protein